MVDINVLRIKTLFVPVLFVSTLTSASAGETHPSRTDASSLQLHATGQQSSASKPANPALAAPVVPPLIIIAPTEVRTNPTLAGGCWVRLFPEPEFKGIDDLTIAGPIALSAIHTPAGGVYWKHKAESILVGPKATMTVYESESYRDKAAELKPGTREPQLRKGLKFTQSINSLKIACAG